MTKVQYLWRRRGDMPEGLYPRKPEHMRADAILAAAFDDLVEWYRTAFPGAELEPELDYEDWTESVTRLQAAVMTGMPVFEVGGADKASLVRAWNCEGVEAWTPDLPSIYLGTYLRDDPLLAKLEDGPRAVALYTGRGCQWQIRPVDLAWPPASIEAVDSYAALDTFKRHAGRRAVLCDIRDPGTPGALGDGPALEDTMAE